MFFDSGKIVYHIEGKSQCECECVSVYHSPLNWMAMLLHNIQEMHLWNGFVCEPTTNKKKIWIHADILYSLCVLYTLILPILNAHIIFYIFGCNEWMKHIFCYHFHIYYLPIKIQLICLPRNIEVFFCFVSSIKCRKVKYQRKALI